jgi:LacI family transcriptional regulator
MRPTIKDIARATGLSATAISLVLNDRPNKLSERSKKLILDAAAQLNYRAPGGKRAEPGRTRNIGQIIPDLSNAFFSKLVQGVEAVANQNQYGLLIGCSGNDERREMDAINTMLAKGVEGMLITSSAQADAPAYRRIFSSAGIPVVLVDRVIPALPYSSIAFNHKKGGFLATGHLLNLGHRRIACLTGGPETNPDSAQRIEGYRWAFSEIGERVPKDWLFQGDYSDRSGYQLADVIFDGGFTAVFSCNDMMAYGLYRRAKERGVRIPEDLSVVGFDDIEFSNLVDPPLTTILQSSYELGREAANRIMIEMEDASIFRQSIYFEPSLIVRGSTRPLAEGGQRPVPGAFSQTERGVMA